MSRAGFQVSTATAAMAIGNERLHRNLQAHQEQTGALRGGVRQLGKLYSFGSGDYGRLGHGDHVSHKTATQVDVLRDKDIKKFACGPRHSLALADSGKVYSWGYGGEGQLGHGDFEMKTMPAQIKALDGEHVIELACGEKHSAVLTANGDVFTWGDGSLGQLGLGDFRKQHTPHRVMDLAGKMAVKLSCGAFHTACLTEDMSVYTWGQGGSGRLGHDNEHDLSSPTLVSSLQSKGIRSIRCFAEHTMALTVDDEGAERDVFDSSSKDRLQSKVKELEVKLSREVMHRDQAVQALENSHSKLVEAEQNARNLTKQVEALLSERVDLYMKMQALESQLSISTTDRANLDEQLRSLVNIPTKLEEISSQGVRQIAVGSAHILALSDAGDVYAWGTGGSGQLGLGKRRNYPTPQLVWGMMRKGVRQIAAGDAHSLALTYNGQVFSWGSSKAGQLGHGNRKTELLPKMIEELDVVGHDISSTVRLIGAGSRHSVCVFGNGEVYMWGRPDFGRLGRAKNDAALTPRKEEALWRREVAEGHTDRTKALGKQEITELLDQNLDVHDIERYFPDIQSDSDAALYLARAVADDLQKRVNQLHKELDQARQDNARQLDDYVREQEKAFEDREREGLDELLKRRRELEMNVEMHEKTVFFQTQVAAKVEEELRELTSQIAKEQIDRDERLAQARTEQKTELNKSLNLALDSLKQHKKDKEIELQTAKKQAAYAQEDLEQAQQALSLTRVDIRKHEKLGYKKSIDNTKLLIAQIAALSQRLAETAVEHIDPSMHGVLNSTAGLRDLLAISNADIDRICAQAAEFASDDHVDVVVRQQLATLLFDNAEMRKQLNAYTEGILTQTMQKLDVDGLDKAFGSEHSWLGFGGGSPMVTGSSAARV